MNPILVPRSFSSVVRRSLAAAAVGLALASATGCIATAESARSAAAEERVARAELLGVPGAALVASIDELTLRPDQRQAIDRIRAGVETQAAPVREARAKLGAALADAVRTGKVDRQSLQPLIDGLAASVTATKPAIQQAMNELHATLDATQRKELVSSMRDKLRGLRHHHGGRARLMALAEELALTGDQIDTIKTKVKAEIKAQVGGYRDERGKMKDKLEAAAAAFESDKFDAKALDLGDHAPVWARRGTGMVAAVLDAAVPVLTPAQRTLLAEKIVELAGGEG